LIKSLSIALGIDNTLLIFSHDVWDEGINNLVRSIDFTEVIQIFYPFSLQTHTNSFPGESRNDCPRDANLHKAHSMSCINAAWPDIYGHYREAKFTQTKHHWWWKANHVFHTLDVTKNFEGNVLFLEEDHYVSTDFLHVLKLMIAEKKNSPSKVDILCLGTYLRKFNFRSSSKKTRRSDLRRGERDMQILSRRLKEVSKPDKSRDSHVFVRQLLWVPELMSSIWEFFNKAEITEWISSKHNMGMAFTRNEWNKIVSCSSSFCQYDDYNWDWSLQHVSLNCMKEKLQVLMAKGPRVFHIEECGVHHKKSNCDSDTVIDKLGSILKSAKKYFFPEKLSVISTRSKTKTKLKKANGGWGDKRDHWLCINFTLSSL